MSEPETIDNRSADPRGPVPESWRNEPEGHGKQASGEDRKGSWNRASSSEITAKAAAGRPASGQRTATRCGMKTYVPVEYVET